MTLEEKVSNEITWAKTAKGIAPYLNVTVPEVTQPKRGVKDVIYSIVYWPLVALGGWRDKKLEEQTKQMCRERDEEEARMYKEMGLETQQEKDAFTVAHFTGLALGRYVRSYEDICDDICYITSFEFEKVLDDCIQSGIASLGGKIVNSDFKDKAKEWLLNEIYARASPETTLMLLEKVSFTLDDKRELIYLI